MTTKLSPYAPPPPLRSALIKNVTDAIPPIDELEQLQAELKLIKQRTLERAKKAGEDMKTIEESMRRMKEKEKGKARAIDKVKRERDSRSLFCPQDACLASSDRVRLYQPQPHNVLACVFKTFRQFVHSTPLFTCRTGECAHTDTPMPDSDESRSPYSVSSKLRATPHPAVPLPSSSSRSSVDPRRLYVVPCLTLFFPNVQQAC